VAGAARDRRQFWWAIATPPIAFSLSCINPEGIAQPLAFRIVTDIWVQSVAEWVPLPLSRWPPTAIAVVLAAVVTTVAALALRRRAAWWNLAFFAVLCMFAVRYQRFLTWAMIAAVPLILGQVGLIIQAAGESGRPRLWRAVGLGTMWVAAAWAAVTLVVDRRLFSEIGTGPDPKAPYHPERACQFVIEAAAPAPLFNSYPLGSYLMHCLGPRYPVFIDGRAWSLYTNAFYAHYRAAASTPARFRALIDEHPSGWAIVSYDPFAVQLAADPARWHLLYFDDTTLVYANAEHPATSALAQGPGFRWLDPLRIVQLGELPSAQRREARRELELQSTRCPTCYRTLLAEAAIALAAGDDTSFIAARDRLLEKHESAEIALLSARHALARGDRAGAAVLFERFRALGGDPRLPARYLSPAPNAAP
jgi:hypothetical protein